jgi:putative phage-type endonuclease
MQSDSDFIPEESDTASTKSTEDQSEKSIESISAISTIVESIFDAWLEEDVNELSNNLYQLFEEYHAANIISISYTKFVPDMLEHVAQIIFQDLLAGTLCEPDDYEELFEFVENTLEVWYDFASYERRSISYGSTIHEKTKTNNAIDLLTQKITSLQNIKQPKQKSKEWYEFRHGMISASNLWKALGSESNQNSLIYEKCQPLESTSQQSFYSNNTESALHWGNKYEQVTVMIYENMFNTQVGEFGCIRHPSYDFIGASPDGINIDPTNQRYGRMLEIKNVVNRDITGIPKEDYWVQTQIQMEVCDLDECDFVETRFLEHPNADAFYADEEHDYKGVTLCFIERTKMDQVATKSGGPTYIYMPVDAPLDEEAIEEWTQQQKAMQKNNGLVLLETQYWYLAEFSCVYIPRNKKWFSAVIPKITNIWTTILKERVDGYDHRAPKKKLNKNAVQVSNDGLSSSYMVQNMPLTNSVCLIKLDEDGNVY